jgi:hypothetical protein
MRIEALRGWTVRCPEMDRQLAGYVWHFMQHEVRCGCEECTELRSLMTPTSVPLVPFAVSFSQAAMIMQGTQTNGRRSDRALCFAGRVCEAMSELILLLDYTQVPARVLHNLEQAQRVSHDRIDRDRIRLWFRDQFAQQVVDHKEMEFLMVHVDRLGAQGVFEGHVFDRDFRVLVHDQAKRLIDNMRRGQSQ